MPADRSVVYQKVTARIVTMLKDGVVPWRKPWAADSDAPRNLTWKDPKQTYTGANFFMLWATAYVEGYESPYWLTYIQLQKHTNGLGRIKKGEAGTLGVKWVVKPDIYEEGEDGEQVLARKGYAYPITFIVFNTEQCLLFDEEDVVRDDTGKTYVPEENWSKGKSLPYPKVEPRSQFVPHVEAKRVVEGMPNKPEINHGGSRAFYNSRDDIVGVPNPEMFNSPGHYYAVKFHELAHATGHKDRLDRPPVNEGKIIFGNEDYSKEELVAEMGAAMIYTVLGLDAPLIENTAAYIQGWLKALEDDPKMVVQAAQTAQKATDYILADWEPVKVPSPAMHSGSNVYV